MQIIERGTRVAILGLVVATFGQRSDPVHDQSVNVQLPDGQGVHMNVRNCIVVPEDATRESLLANLTGIEALPEGARIVTAEELAENAKTVGDLNDKVRELQSTVHELQTSITDRSKGQSVVAPAPETPTQVPTPAAVTPTADVPPPVPAAPKARGRKKKEAEGSK